MEEPSVLVFDPYKNEKPDAPVLGPTRIPFEAIRANVQAALQEWTKVLVSAATQVPGAHIEHVELTLGIALEDQLVYLGPRQARRLRAGSRFGSSLTQGKKGPRGSMNDDFVLVPLLSPNEDEM